MALAYTAAGGLLLFSGFKGSTISDTVKHVLQGNLNVTPGETIGTPSISDTSGTSSGGSGGNVPDVSATASQTQWNTALLKAIGAPVTQANLQSLANWESKEEPTNDWAHWNNPLNTTVGAGTPVNSAGVKQFSTLQEGLGATAATLEQGNFQALRMALISGQGLSSGISGVSQELSTWSGGGYNSV
jgi:hypothetical protein